MLLFANSISLSGGDPAAFEFGIYDGHARRIGSATRISTGAKNVALLPIDAHLPHSFEIREASGGLLLLLVRPARLLASKWVVLDPVEREVGRITQDKVMLRSTFALAIGGEPVAEVRSERWTFRRLVVKTPDGRLLARIVVPPLGHATMNTENGMNSVLHLLEPVAWPLRAVLVATALAVATGP